MGAPARLLGAGTRQGPGGGEGERGKSGFFNFPAKLREEGDGGVGSRPCGGAAVGRGAG